MTTTHADPLVDATHAMKMLLASFFLSAVAMAPAVAMSEIPLTIQPSEKKVRGKDWRSVAAKPTEPHAYIEITHDADLPCNTRSMFKSLAASGVLKLHAGIYPIERQMRHEKTGQLLYLVPVASDLNVEYGYNNAAGTTFGYEHYIAVDPETLAVFPAEVVWYKQKGAYLDPSMPWWERQYWTFGCYPTVVLPSDRLLASEKPMIRVVNEADYVAAQEKLTHAMANLARDDEARRLRQLERERPLKSQIGASICKLNGRVLWQGFTEGISPDNGKIQIRIWRASYPDNGRPSSLSPSGFQPAVVWESPDGWKLCEN